jgi:hypothetical protein
MASTPPAQPTSNCPDQGEAAKDETKPAAAAATTADGRRLPERPTKEKREHIGIIYITKQKRLL